MAEPIKRVGKHGTRYLHTVMINGTRKSETFDTKGEARQWEAELRVAVKADPNTPLLRKRHKLSDACDRYLETVSTTKRGAVDWETRRFNLLIAKFPKVVYMEDLTSDLVARWRDEMIKTVTGSTVNRYFNLFSNLFSVAKREWKWVESNPFSDVRRPAESQPRTQVWRWQQIKRILREGQRRGGKTGEVVKAFHIALHTSLRLQEALAAPTGYDKATSVIVIPPNKTSKITEKVPTVPRARRLLSKQQPFTVEANEASVLFSRLTSQVGITGLEFKDSRATALTLLSKRMPVQLLQKISRHRDINILTNCYYRETAEEISSRLR